MSASHPNRTSASFAVTYTDVDNADAQVESFIDKFDPDNQALIRSTRAALRMRLRDCAELVYDNYNFFVIGYSPTERPSVGGADPTS